MDANDLASFINPSNPMLDDYIQSCWDTAVVLVDDFIGDNYVPDEVINRAYLICGSRLYEERNAPNGITQFNDFTVPVRTARNVMVSVYPLLGNYMVMGL